MSALTQEIARRKTFAIISHPDAGKTTLTEKFLLFGGAIQTAGAVKSNKITKTAASDFMDIERQRGISVATSVMAFEYEDCLINLLDTPGHRDFAEDTYRTLTAVDSAVMVIDAAKGIVAKAQAAWSAIASAFFEIEFKIPGFEVCCSETLEPSSEEDIRQKSPRQKNSRQKRYRRQLCAPHRHLRVLPVTEPTTYP